MDNHICVNMPKKLLLKHAYEFMCRTQLIYESANIVVIVQSIRPMCVCVHTATKITFSLCAIENIIIR